MFGVIFYCFITVWYFRRSRPLSHITRVCTILTFSSAVASLRRPDRPSSSTLFLPLLNSAAYFSLCYKKETGKSAPMRRHIYAFIVSHMTPTRISYFIILSYQTKQTKSNIIVSVDNQRPKAKSMTDFTQGLQRKWQYHKQLQLVFDKLLVQKSFSPGQT